MLEKKIADYDISPSSPLNYALLSSILKTLKNSF